MRVLGFAFAVLIMTSPVVASDLSPDFVISSSDGQRIQLGKLLEKGPVLIDFWATWYKPGVKAMPKFQAIHEKYKDRGLTVLGVNEDGPRGQAKIKPFLRARGLTFLNGLDLDGGLMQRFRASTLPTTLLVDVYGEIVIRQSGYNQGKKPDRELIEVIELLLAVEGRSDDTD